MTSTTYPEFGGKTESLEVAEKFAEQIQGKTILITGVNLKGVGFATSKAFASQSAATLIIAGRTPSKIRESVDALKSEFPSVDYRTLKLDLSSQKGVREAAAEVLSWKDVPTIDIVVNNAALMLIPERTLSEEGIEIQFATNHIGHFLFTSLIVSKLIKASEGKPKGSTRIVNVTSLSPTVASIRWSDLNFEKLNKDLPEDEQPPYSWHEKFGEQGNLKEKSYLPLEGYNQSKVANVLFTVAMNKRLYEKYGILTLAVHPGIIFTELGRNAKPETQAALAEMYASGLLDVKNLGQGAATSLVAATDPKLEGPKEKDGLENYGSYLIDCQISKLADARSVSSDNAERLWGLSEELVKEKFKW